MIAGESDGGDMRFRPSRQPTLGRASDLSGYPDKAARLHNRMPVVVEPEAWPLWLGEELADTSALKALLAPFPSDGMICWPVNARVGNVKNNDASLIEPINAVSH
jgi:putative SOS response-associated peptidase YedK